jgi:hypothetical protein
LASPGFEESVGFARLRGIGWLRQASRNRLASPGFEESVGFAELVNSFLCSFAAGLTGK